MSPHVVAPAHSLLSLQHCVAGRTASALAARAHALTLQPGLNIAMMQVPLEFRMMQVPLEFPMHATCLAVVRSRFFFFFECSHHRC